MERLVRLAGLWPWLPVFRAVAETQHVRLAAERLAVAPSAVSRNLRLLEARLGRPLFHRAGRRLELNPDGEALLAAVRDGMRRIDDAVGALDGSVLNGAIRVAAPGTLSTALLIPALLALGRDHPTMRPSIGTVPDDAVERLLRGDLDLVLTSRPRAHPALEVRRLGELRCGIYCGPAHPLGGRRTVEAKDLAPHPFVAPPADDDGVAREGWPAEIARVVSVEVISLHLGLELCAGGTLLGVFPDLVVARSPAAGGLRRLPVELVAPVPVMAMLRHHSAISVELVVAAVAESLRASAPAGD